MDEFEKEFRLEETQVRIALHHVLDPPLGAVECVQIRIVGLDIGQCDESCLGIQVDLLIKINTSTTSYEYVVSLNRII